MDKHKFLNVKLTSWMNIHLIQRHSLGAFVFRGQGDTSWSLSSTIERSCNKFLDSELFPRKNHEHWALDEFKKKAHLYTEKLPELTNNFEWLALMQHHGASTRLVDFTESIYTAAFFAAVESVNDLSIWCVNRKILHDNIYKQFGFTYDTKTILKDSRNYHSIQFINEYIGENTIDTISLGAIPLESTKLSARIARQKGLFICPVNIEKSFTENISHTFGEEKIIFNTIPEKEFLLNSFQNKNDVCIIKIDLPKTEISSILYDLNNMNITSESLFPDLDGLARSITQTIIRR